MTPVQMGSVLFSSISQALRHLLLLNLEFLASFSLVNIRFSSESKVEGLFTQTIIKNDRNPNNSGALGVEVLTMSYSVPALSLTLDICYSLSLIPLVSCHLSTFYLIKAQNDK